METFAYIIVPDWVTEYTDSEEGKKLRYPFPPYTTRHGITIQVIGISEAKVTCPEIAKMWLATQVSDWTQ